MARATRSNPPASLIALALYLALAVIVFWTVWDAPTRDWIGHSLDPPLFIRHFRWLPFALGDVISFAGMCAGLLVSMVWQARANMRSGSGRST